MNQAGIDYCKQQEKWLSSKRHRLKFLGKKTINDTTIENATFANILECYTYLKETILRLGIESRIFDMGDYTWNVKEYFRLARACLIDDNKNRTCYFKSE